MGWLKWIFLGSLLTLSACSSTRLSQQQIDDFRPHQLYINQHGNLLHPASQAVVEDEQTYVDGILGKYRQAKSQHPDLVLSIYIHGGLNTFSSTKKRLNEAEIDKLLDDGIYPLFIAWSSGPFSNYIDHLFFLRRGVTAKVMGPVSSPFILLEDTLRSIARIPVSTYNVLLGQNSLFKRFETKERKAAKKSLREIEGQGFNLSTPDHEGKQTFAAWASVWNPVKLVTAPFLDGLGTGAWDSMLRRTDLVLRKADAFNGSPGSATAVTKFLRRFERDFGNSPVNIIGHSMGSIVANNIISKHPQIEFKNIVFMAAACKIKDLEYVISPYMEANQGTKFYNLSLNAKHDISENTALDFIPRGSLLIWIDQTFGKTNSFQDRTAGFWFNIVRAASNTFRHPSVRHRVHLTQFEVNGKVPREHGDFDNFDFWYEAFWRGDSSAKRAFLVSP